MNRKQRRRAMRIGEKGAGVVVATDIRQQAVSKLHAPDLAEPPPGEHMWVYITVYRCHDPEGAEFLADMENLLTIEGPGCFLCEEPYSPELAQRRCVT